MVWSRNLFVCSYMWLDSEVGISYPFDQRTSIYTHLGVFQFKNNHGHVMHALGISLGWVYKSESLAEVSRDNRLYETYDDQGLGD